MCLRWRVCLVVLVSYSIASVDLLSQYPIVLIVSYDAFRHDYLSRGVTPVLTNLRKSATYAEYMDNVFVTKTFPNHHSIATGLYPENHGILGNSLYDSLYEKRINYSYELWHYSNSTLPIWIANEKKGNGRYSGIMMWPGNEYEYCGMKPTYQRAWNYSVSWEERVDMVVQWILNPDKPANLVLLYIEEPDYHGHSFGIDSDKFKTELILIDNITKYLLDKLEYFNLTNHVNIFFLSDHGMVSTTKKDVIDLRKYISNDFYDIYEGSPGIHIYPKPGKMNDVFSALQKAVKDGAPFRVFKKDEILEHWHFRNNRRAPPILALADPPHAFHDFYPYVESLQEQWNITVTDDTPFGMHGYDNDVKSMKPYFMALGPAIKQNYKIDPFKTLDLFSLWAHMLGFPEYSEATNGSLDTVSKMLRTTKSDSFTSGNVGSILIGLILLTVIVIITVYVVYRKWYMQRKIYLIRYSHESFESKQRLLDAEEEA